MNYAVNGKKRQLAVKQQAKNAERGVERHDITIINPKNMSKGQRGQYLLAHLKVPGYMAKHLIKNDTVARIAFNLELSKQVLGESPVDIDLLKVLLDNADRERYATPEIQPWHDRVSMASKYLQHGSDCLKCCGGKMQAHIKERENFGIGFCDAHISVLTCDACGFELEDWGYQP